MEYSVEIKKAALRSLLSVLEERNDFFSSGSPDYASNEEWYRRCSHFLRKTLEEVGGNPEFRDINQIFLELQRVMRDHRMSTPEH